MSLRDRVVTPRMAGMAMEQAPEEKPEPALEPAPPERLLGVSGAARVKAAGAWKKGRQERAVRADGDD